MIGFWGKDRVKQLLDKSRQKFAAWFKRPAADDGEQTVSEERPKITWVRVKNGIVNHKWTLAKAVSACALISAMVWSGHQYVQAQMADIFHVYVNGKQIGTVSDPAIVEKYSDSKKQMLAKGPENVTMVVEEPRVEFMAERAFNAKTDDEQLLTKLGGYFTAYPVGVELFVDGKSAGFVKDEETAKAVLQQVKDNALAAMGKKKEPGKVSVLSAVAEETSPVRGELQSIDFVQKVETKETKVDPKQVLNAEDMRNKLETGNAQPIKYTVQQGDCVSCIAQKFDIPKQVIYQNNPWIENDMIKVGEELDLTVLKPTLAVKTVEKVVETQEIQYEVEYQMDDTMRLGEIAVISPGKNGQKKLTLQLTKVNGLLQEEAVLSEEIVQQPVKEIAKKGTKVVLGEGTGKFAWPVASYKITSTFGTRWGALHKGIDLTGNRDIKASDNGKVIFAGKKDGYGNTIILDHLNGYRTLYGHMSKLYVSEGAIVEKGEKIGYMGSTGNSTGVHLHFEIQRNEKPENPLKYLNQ